MAELRSASRTDRQGPRKIRRRLPQNCGLERLADALLMARTFKPGDHVSWNSEAGRVRGTIIKKAVSDLRFKGYLHHASREEPQYLIKSDKTDHIAIHKGRALRLISSRADKKFRRAN